MRRIAFGAKLIIFRLPRDTHTINTEAFLSLNFKNKIKYFYISILPTDLALNIVFQFCRQHLAPRSTLDFNNHMPDFRSAIEDKFLTWEPKNERPNISFRTLEM